jgi:hypothetical protein
MNLSYELLPGSNFVRSQNFWGDSHMSHYIRFRPFNVDTLEIRQWCNETYGPEGLINTIMLVRWFDDLGNGVIRFRDEVDAELFMLRWS